MLSKVLKQVTRSFE